MSIRYAHEVSSLLNVVLATKDNINLVSKNMLVFIPEYMVFRIGLLTSSKATPLVSGRKKYTKAAKTMFIAMKKKRHLSPTLFKKVGKNCEKIVFATFCICEHIPTAWARTLTEKTSAVQIQTVAPQDGL